MSIQDLFNSLKQGQVRPVYLILGRENYLDRLIQQWFLNLIPKREQTTNFTQDDLQTVGLNLVLNDAVSVPFWGRFRLIWVKNPYFLTGKSGQPVNRVQIINLIKYLKHPLNSTILVFIAPYQKLDRRKKITQVMKRYSTVLNLNNISEGSIKTYVRSWIRNSGYHIDTSVLELLVQKTGGQLSTIMNELPKLLLYSYHTKRISRKAVELLVTKSLNQNVFDLVNEVLQSKTTQAVTLYHELLIDGQQPLQINSILLSQFRLLLQVMILYHRGMGSFKLSRVLRAHPYRIKLALRADRFFSLNELVEAYLGLVKMEQRLKSTNQSAELLFEMFIIKFTSKKNSQVS